jgi:hypothetical protein
MTCIAFDPNGDSLCVERYVGDAVVRSYGHGLPLSKLASEWFGLQRFVIDYE